MTHNNSYTVLVHDTDFVVNVVEFRAPSVAVAMCVARGSCPDQPAELFENGRRLGALNRDAAAAFVQRAV
jgi:hypothetical protein